MQFGAELIGLLNVELILRIRKQQLPEITFADRVFHGLRAAGELREVKCVSIERHHGRIPLSGLVPLHDAFLKNQKRSAIVVQQLADLGKNRDALVRIAPIVKENAGELSVWAPLANVDGDAVFDRGEAAWLYDAAHDVGTHFGQPVAQHAQPLRREICADRPDQQRHNECRGHERAKENPRRHASGVHHDDLGIVGHFVEHVRDRDQQRDWCDYEDEQRYDQPCDADEYENCLALACHDVDVTQCLGNPDHRGQADQHDKERTQRGAEDVSVDRPHPQHRPLIRHKPNPACGFPTGREAFPA